ncbi:hypothetical protein [Pseudaquabacterium rugosum]|uniref:Uncharacterized protein n=1 Tax=Pseudaquabacterium rugosum TaxID=2984194 RepID=A0ABU9BB63_9BURK
MNRDPKSIRRRALLATLAPVLDEHTLLRELWHLQDALRGEAVGDIIELIDALAARQGVPAASCKRLYTELFRTLRLGDDALPPDPWPAMQAVRPPAEPVAPVPARPPVAPAAAPARPGGAGLLGSPGAWPTAADDTATSPFVLPFLAGAPAVRPALRTAMTLPVMAMPSTAFPSAGPAPFGAGFAAPFRAAPAVPAVGGGAAAPAAPAIGAADVADLADLADAPEPVDPLAGIAARVHGAVMRALVAEVQRHHREALDEIRNDALRLLAGSPMPARLREPFARAWERPLSHDWVLAGSPTELAALVRLMHRALELSFGRVGADHILQRAATAADGVPEAAQFPPARLLPPMV